MKKIDIHGHVLFPETLGKAGKFGPEVIETDGKMVLRVGDYHTEIPRAAGGDDGWRERSSPDTMAAALDKYGFDMLGITGSPLFYLYWAPDDIAIRFAELQNDLNAKFVKQRPDRFFFNATLPLQNMDATLAELKRAKSIGAKGIVIGTEGAGRNLDDEYYWPFYQALVDEDMTLALHPYPLPSVDGFRDKYNLSWVTGYNYQETQAFAQMTLGGVFDDFPKLRVYVTHGGGFTPFQFERIAHAQTMKMPDVKAKRPIEEYVRNFYFDTLVYTPESTRLLLSFSGADNLVVGTNFSGFGWSNEFKRLSDLGLPEADLEKIFYKNAKELFHLDA